MKCGLYARLAERTSHYGVNLTPDSNFHRNMKFVLQQLNNDMRTRSDISICRPVAKVIAWVSAKSTEERRAATAGGPPLLPRRSSTWPLWKLRRNAGLLPLFLPPRSVRISRRSGEGTQKHCTHIVRSGQKATRTYSCAASTVKVIHQEHTVNFDTRMHHCSFHYT